ncbi:26S proteasome non-ATPase regulatory subunit 1 homolog A [Tanacetum coccineum]
MGECIVGIGIYWNKNNKAIRQLLHFVVSDVSDDVRRRTAVLALGFVGYSKPEQVGISCASTGLSEVISLLKPMTSNVTDFVRQGALIDGTELIKLLNDVKIYYERRLTSVNKQLNDKERVVAAMENPNLHQLVDEGLHSSKL